MSPFLPSALGPRVCEEAGLPQGPRGAAAAKGGAAASLALAPRAPGWRGPSVASPAQALDRAGPSWPSFPELLVTVRVSAWWGQPASPCHSLHRCVVRMLGAPGHAAILTLTLRVTSRKVTSCSRPQSYHANSRGEERFGNFLLEFGGGSSDEREMANQAPDFQSSPVFACSVHSLDHHSLYTLSCAGQDRH